MRIMICLKIVTEVKSVLIYADVVHLIDRVLSYVLQHWEGLTIRRIDLSLIVGTKASERTRSNQ